MADPKNDQLKLSKSVAKRIKKVATGPLLGPIEPTNQAPAEAVPATQAPLGTIQDVREKIRRATEG